MKALVQSIVLLGLAFSAAHADILRLRDGRTIFGSYVGGTPAELWFQSNAVSPETYPTLLVESVRFGPQLSMGHKSPESRTFQSVVYRPSSRVVVYRQSWSTLRVVTEWLASLWLAWL